jgi:hypothetical protein
LGYSLGRIDDLAGVFDYSEKIKAAGIFVFFRKIKG